MIFHFISSYKVVTYMNFIKHSSDLFFISHFLYYPRQPLLLLPISYFHLQPFISTVHTPPPPVVTAIYGIRFPCVTRSCDFYPIARHTNTLMAAPSEGSYVSLCQLVFRIVFLLLALQLVSSIYITYTPVLLQYSRPLYACIQNANCNNAPATPRKLR